MKSVETTCPSAQEIERLLLSDATEEELDRFALHLNTCEVCQRHAESITSQSVLESDLHWATEVRAQTSISVEDPLRRLSEILPEYTLIREIGRGGMGIVYMAEQPKLHRMVAIKVLPALIGVVRPEYKVRFRREAELAAGLDHTNIISVYDFGEADGTLYYTMQLIKGRSLRGILREIEDTGAVDCVVGTGSKDATNATRSSSKSKSSSQTPEVGHAYFLKIAHWIAEVADALQYAHDHGVIHRDIKPSNLLLTEDGRLMISDFGLARPTNAQSMTAANSLLGTCRYMAPEQFNRDERQIREHQHLVDVYALGATFYELLAFRPVYSAPDDRQVVQQIQHTEVTPPSRFVKQVPIGLETICLKAISKRRQDRYASAAEFADDLRRWALDMPIHARRQSASERAVRFIKRRKLTVSLGTACVVLVGATGVMYSRSLDASARSMIAMDSAARSASERLIQQARVHINAEEFDLAIIAADEAIESWPDNPDASAVKATALLRAGRSSEAQTVLREAITQRPDDWRSRFLLGMIIHPGHGSIRSVGPQFEKSSVSPDTLRLSATLGGYISQIERLHPESAELLCLQSCVEPDHQTAIAMLDEALEIDPNLTEALVEKASRLGYVGQFGAALKAIDQAIKLGHGGDDIYGMKGIALYQLNDQTGAIAATTEAIHRDPTNVDWLYNRAVSYTYLERFNEAIDDATRAIELRPDYASAYMVRARAYTAINRPDEALSDFSIAAELDPRKGDIYVERGYLYWLAGDYDNAMADANTLINLEPDQLRGYQRRAQVYLRLQQWDHALADLDYCLALDPDEETNYRLRGGVLFYAHRYEEAIDAFSESIARLPTFYGSYEYRAMALARLGRSQEAIADLTSWITIGESTAYGFMRRGMVYEMMGELQLAKHDYTQASKDPDLAQYPQLWTSILMLLNDDPDADNSFSALRETLDPDSWIGAIASMLAGEITPDELSTIADTPGARAEVGYYIGIYHLLNNDLDAAKQIFETTASSAMSTSLSTHEIDFAALRARQIN